MSSPPEGDIRPFWGQCSIQKLDVSPPWALPSYHTCQQPCPSAIRSWWRHKPPGEVLGHLGPTFHCKWVNPPRPGSNKVPLMERPLLLWCKTSVKHCPVSAPLMGCQQPSDGLFSPMEVWIDHLPMCTVPKWYLSVGHGPAHQKICPPWAHQS